MCISALAGALFSPHLTFVHSITDLEIESTFINNPETHQKYLYAFKFFGLQFGPPGRKRNPPQPQNLSPRPVRMHSCPDQKNYSITCHDDEHVCAHLLRCVNSVFVSSSITARITILRRTTRRLRLHTDGSGLFNRKRDGQSCQ